MNLENARDKIANSLWKSVEGPVCTSTGKSVQDDGWFPLMTSVWNSVRDSVDIGLTEPIRKERKQG